MKEFLSLIALKCAVQWRNGVEQLKVMRRYYRKISFVKADVCLLLQYLWSNPFRISRQFWARRAEEAPYGETPLTTMECISQKAALSASDVVFELGCGRGRVALWLHAFVGCEVVGIEKIPLFVLRAQRVVRWCGLSKLTFRLEEMLEADLSRATVVYLYGTCLTDQEIQALITNLMRLRTGARIITISYPLTDYVDARSSPFKLEEEFPASFNWGETQVYVHSRM